MSDEQTEKVVIFGTHGPEDPERATLPFIMGNAALIMESEAVVILQGTGVLLAKEGCYEHVFAGGMPALQDQVKLFIEQGGKILVCTPCIKERKIDESMLIKSAEPVAAARAIQETLQANGVLNY